MRTKLTLFITCFLAVITTVSNAQLPYLDKTGDKVKLIVDGKPFIILGGELHNSTGSDKEAMNKVWKEMKVLNLNTVLAYAYWELIEPKENQYNFELIDQLILGAKKENIKVVLVWFGSWKSTASTYAPDWVKTNPKRFQRYTLENGKTLEIMSPFSEENRNADAKAYAALMQHIKEVDKQHTIIMTQVENEPGCFDNYRDLSPDAIKVWQSLMSAEMLNYLTSHKGKLFPALEKAWADNGYKTKGTWEEVLGKSTEQGEYKFYTEELFMAYQYSKYINYITEKGRKVHNLPAFCNGWLFNKRGTYPHGTINPHVLDAYRAGGTALDFYSPNVYTIEYDELFGNYTLGGNTLFIPESLLLPAGALYSIGAYNSIGFAPFGIDGDRVKSPDNATNLKILKETNKAISGMMGLITTNYNSPKMKGAYIYPKRAEQKLEIGDYNITASNLAGGGFSMDFGKSLDQVGKAKISMAQLTGNDAPPPTNPSTAPAPPPPTPFGSTPKGIGSAIIIQNAVDEFYVVGYGLKLNFALKEGIAFNHLGFLSIDEGYFENDKFIATKRWNGDEQKSTLPEDKLTTLKITLYRL
jgi:Domain of unknown function (DUF5597)/Beta-galactosidase